MGGAPTPPTPVDPGDISNYVQNGLVLHLDGINKGGVSGKWSSLVGTENYTLNAHSIVETNAIRMDGSGLLESTRGTEVNVDGATGTIEVCAEYLGTGYGVVVVFGISGKLCFIISDSDGVAGYVFRHASATDSKWNPSNMQDVFTCSMNISRCVYNGIAQSTLSGQSWGSTLDFNCIGGRAVYENRRYANVRIYSIRKYNRLLTEAEMVRNQIVDNARFNLGLNIQ